MLLISAEVTSMELCMFDCGDPQKNTDPQCYFLKIELHILFLILGLQLMLHYPGLLILNWYSHSFPASLAGCQPCPPCTSLSLSCTSLLHTFDRVREKIGHKT